MDQPSIVVRLEDHVGKLVRIGQPAERGHGVLEHLAGIDRRLANLSRRHLHVLLCHGIDHVTGSQVPRRQFLRIEPEPHAVIALAQVGDVADALEPGQFIAQLDGGVVTQVEAIARVVRREQVDDHQHAGRLLLD